MAAQARPVRRREERERMMARGGGLKRVTRVRGNGRPETGEGDEEADGEDEAGESRQEAGESLSSITGEKRTLL